MSFDGKHRPQKDEMRGYALPQRPVANSLWLPGGDCLCVKRALDKDLLARGNHYFVERDKKAATRIRGFISSHSWERKPKLHVGDISTLVLPQPLDYAFFDFLGGLEVSVAQWLHNLEVNKGASLVFTFAYGWRGSRFMRICEDVFYPTQYFCDLSVETQIEDPVILLYLATLRSVFDGYEFEVLRPIKYKDSKISMILYRFQNFRKLRNRRFGYFQSLVEGDEMTRAAALKAWETRRENAKNRSATAKKAWKTRRKNAAKK